MWADAWLLVLVAEWTREASRWGVTESQVPVDPLEQVQVCVLPFPLGPRVGRPAVGSSLLFPGTGELWRPWGSSEVWSLHAPHPEMPFHGVSPWKTPLSFQSGLLWGASPDCPRLATPPELASPSPPLLLRPGMVCSLIRTPHKRGCLAPACTPQVMRNSLPFSPEVSVVGWLPRKF